MPDDEIRSIHNQTLDDLLRIVSENNAQADTDVIRLAFDFAREAHGEQRRKSGALYIVHPLGTAIALAELGLDESTIAAGLLHDVPEDTERTLDDVRKEFGDEIGFLVEGITKLGKLKYRGMDRYIENLRRMFVAMAQDVRVILIKFADRMDNLETLLALPPEKRRRIALESLEIYAPIANRLGMGAVKGRLEDLAFPFVYPEEYQWMTKKVVPQFKAKEAFVNQFSEFIKQELEKEGIAVLSIHGRSKHLYSLYQKLLRHQRDLSKIHDLVALRIIVKDVGNCYAALGIVHKLCKPLKGRIKDYIAQPKPNGYQSLHTTIFSPRTFSQDDIHTEIVEIQIRTPDMHAEAEYGIAAHWKYKESEGGPEQMQRKLDWMKQLAEFQHSVQDEAQLLETLKIDFFQNHIFVFTPRGDVIELPEDATPVDFAYKIHTSLGNTGSAAGVIDHMASLDTRLKNGDVVEITTNPHRKGPSADWLKFVKTNSARHHIRNYMNRKNQKLLHTTKVIE
jgi:GTP pyrophosphokinase